jgi:hypothetical protein
LGARRPPPRGKTPYLSGLTSPADKSLPDAVEGIEASGIKEAASLTGAGTIVFVTN